MKRLGFCDDLYPLVLNGKKTQTRRIKKPKFEVGEEVAVACAWQYAPDVGLHRGMLPRRVMRRPGTDEGPSSGTRWCPAYSMPLAAVEATIRILGIEQQRLQDITEADCIVEGIRDAGDGDFYIEGNHFRDAREAFRCLWDSIAKPSERWDDNPTVWKVTFTLGKGD